MTRHSSTYLTAYRSIEEFLKAPPGGCVLLVSGQSGRVSSIVRLADAARVPVRNVSKTELKRVAGDAARDCALEVRAAPESPASRLNDIIPPVETRNSVIVVLDHVTDPHNFGAILRSADQFEVDGVVVPDRRAAAITPVVLQASAGAAPHVRVVSVANLASAIETLKGADFWVYGADMAGESAHRTNLSGRVALVMGAEGAGLSRLIRERSDALIRVPAAGFADSFNVSVATGILLYEIRRQQGWFDGR